MTRPPVVNPDGITHHRGCPLPGWTASPPIAGVQVVRCAGCTTVRLVRPTNERPHR